MQIVAGGDEHGMADLLSALSELHLGEAEDAGMDRLLWREDFGCTLVDDLGDDEDVAEGDWSSSEDEPPIEEDLASGTLVSVLSGVDSLSGGGGGAAAAAATVCAPLISSAADAPHSIAGTIGAATTAPLAAMDATPITTTPAAAAAVPAVSVVATTGEGGFGSESDREEEEEISHDAGSEGSSSEQVCQRRKKRRTSTDIDDVAGLFVCPCKIRCRAREIPRESLVQMRALFRSMKMANRRTTLATMLSTFLPSRKMTGQQRVRPQLQLFGTPVCTRAFCDATYSHINGLYHSLLSAYRSGTLLEPVSYKLHVKSEGSLKSGTQQVIHWLVNYGDEFGYPCPTGRTGRMRRSVRRSEKHSREVVRWLPSAHTRSNVYETLVTCWAGPEEVPTLKTFYHVWSRYLPYIRVFRRASDFCDICAMLMRRWRGEDRALLASHVQRAQVQRRFMKELIADNSHAVFSFDYAQRIKVPHEHKQPGQYFFTTPLRCSLFGVLNNSTSKATVFVVPEGCHPGRNCKTVEHLLSMLYAELRRRRVLTSSQLHPSSSSSSSSSSSGGVAQLPVCIHFFADNCKGENKNQYMLGFLHWLVINNELGVGSSLNHLLAGHTKSSVDGVFGSVKQAYWRADLFFPADVDELILKARTG